MAFILPTSPDMATVLGQSLGQGLQNLAGGVSSGLEGLAKLKMQELDQLHKAKALMPAFKTPGVSEDQARQMAYAAAANPKLAAELLKQSRMGPVIGQEPFPTTSPTGVTMPTEATMPTADVTSPLAETLPTIEQPSDDRGASLQPPIGQVAAPKAPGLYNDVEKALINEGWRMSKATLNPTHMQNAQLQAAKMRENRIEKEKGREFKESQSQLDVNRKYRSEAMKSYKGSDLKTARYKRMLALERAGDINSPAYKKVVDKLGMPWLLKVGTIQQQKAISEAAVELMKVSKGRINEMEFSEMLKSLPSLYTPSEARVAVIEALIDIEELNRLEGKIINDTISEKGLTGSYDLENEVLQRVDQEMKAKTQAIIDKLMKTDNIPPDIAKQLGSPSKAKIGDVKIINGEEYEFVK